MSGYSRSNEKSNLILKTSPEITSFMDTNIE